MRLEKNFHNYTAVINSLDSDKSKRISQSIENLIQKHSSSNAA